MFLNLTPHPIAVELEPGVRVVFEPEATPARVSTKVESLPTIGGFRLQKQVFGQVENLPEPKAGIYLIVSALVLGQCQGRDDVVAPDTGRDAIRDEKGLIVAVRGFVR